MSTIFDLGSIGSLYEDACLNFSDTWISQFFLVFDYWPIFLTFLFMGLAFQHSEVFYLILTFGTMGDGLARWGLAVAFDQRGPEPTCSDDQQMPALAPQSITFLLTVVWMMTSHIWSIYITWYKVGGLYLAATIALGARAWLRFNTGPQMLAGCATGLVTGLVYSYLVLWLATQRRLDRHLLVTPTLTFIPWFQDTLVRPMKPIVTSRRAPEKIFLRATGRVYATADSRRALDNPSDDYVRGGLYVYEKVSDDPIVVSLDELEDRDDDDGDGGDDYDDDYDDVRIDEALGAME